MRFRGVILVLFDSFLVTGSYFNWDWFIAWDRIKNNPRYWPFNKLYGRDGYRVFCGLAGAAITIIGTMLLFG
jgi:hypothetical protein